ncbi:hypothetical protein [Clostridium cylindrosporum]|uniref:ABC-2 family transporter protein n=1 Tax=Clostridium cylindrosporum DSM 605 TaxID=1121307 RepID=A0A0J8DD43_CLOCY|nr:hypothetical protein [Clostridium cylindrosporum]KMT22169.1 hypothetical protein CLCY_4c01420 [Clostridium cylindrosporum DSM 605]
MNQRILYLAFENVKRAFYKKSIIGLGIGLAFLVGYAATIFLVEESNFEVEYTSNDFLLYFFNDFNISGVFLNILYTIFIASMFNNDINYMYISRLKNRSDFLKTCIITVFIATITFMTLVVLTVSIVAALIKDYSFQWGNVVQTLLHGSNGLGLITDILTPVSSIVISCSMYTMGLFIIGLCFYIGCSIFHNTYGGVFVNFIILLIGGVTYFFKISWLYRAIPSINTILAFHSLNEASEYPSLRYSLIYILSALIILFVISKLVSEKYIKEKI